MQIAVGIVAFQRGSHIFTYYSSREQWCHGLNISFIGELFDGEQIRGRETEKTINTMEVRPKCFAIFSYLLYYNVFFLTGGDYVNL